MTAPKRARSPWVGQGIRLGGNIHFAQAAVGNISRFTSACLVAPANEWTGVEASGGADVDLAKIQTEIGLVDASGQLPMSVYVAAFNWLTSYMYGDGDEGSDYDELWKGFISPQFTRQLETVVKERAGITGDELSAADLEKAAAARGAVAIVTALAAGGQLEAVQAREANL